MNKNTNTLFLDEDFGFVHEYEEIRFRYGEPGVLPEKVLISIAYGAAKKIDAKFGDYPLSFAKEDLMQEAFLKVFSIKYDPNRPCIQSIRFLHTSVYNHLLNVVTDVIGKRVKSRKPESRLTSVEELNLKAKTDVDPTEKIFANEQSSLIKTLLEREKDSVTRDMVVEYYFRQKTFKQIAEKYSLSWQRVNQKINVFLNKAKEFMLTNRKYREFFGLNNT